MNCKILLDLSYSNLLAKASGRWLGLIVLPAITLILILPVAAQAVSPIVPCGTETTMCTFADLIKLAENLINFVLFNLAAPLGILSFAVGGILMITARGDKGQLERGKSIFYNTVIGFFIAFGAWLIVEAIIYALTGNASLEAWLGGKVQKQP